MTRYCFNILTGDKPPVVTTCMDLGSGASELLLSEKKK